MCVSESFVNRHPLFTKIQKEHNTILNKVRDCLTRDERKSILNWLENAENEHHRKEETLLFSALLSKKASISGPFCVLYFDQHIFDRPADLAKKLTGQAITWNEYQNIFKENKTSLNIPVEEHQALYTLLTYLRKNQAILTDTEFDKIFNSYFELLELHIVKEERCFFRVCEDLLSTDELDQINSLW